MAESDTQLFQHSLRTDTPYYEGKRTPFTQLLFRRDTLARELSTSNKMKNLFSFKISTLPLSLYVINIDNKVWYLPSTAREENLNRFAEVTDSDDWRYIVTGYLESILDMNKDGNLDFLGSVYQMNRGNAKMFKSFQKKYIHDERFHEKAPPCYPGPQAGNPRLRLISWWE